MERLRDRLSEIAQSHGTGDVVKRFFSYLSNYESLLNLGVTRENLAAEVKRLTEEREALTRLSAKFGLSSEQVTEGIAALKSLQHKGVLPPTLVSYQRVLSAAGLTPETFEKIVTEFSGVEKALAAKKGELDTVDQELEEKGQALKQLQGELGKVKQSINSLRDSGIDQINTMRDSGIKQINSMVNSAAAEVKKLCQGLRDDISRWGDMRAEMGNCEDELKLARYFVKLPLNKEALSSLVADLSLQVVVQYLMIGLAWCRKNRNPKLRPPREITKKYYSIGEYTEVELADVFIWALLVLIGEVGSDKE